MICSDEVEQSLEKWCMGWKELITIFNVVGGTRHREKIKKDISDTHRKNSQPPNVGSASLLHCDLNLHQFTSALGAVWDAPPQMCSDISMPAL